MMILIDSIYINDGGGLILLKYLVNKLQSRNLDVFYLFDERTKSIFENDSSIKNKEFIKNSHFERKKFYTQYKSNFSHVLCFGNVPPPIKLNAKVFVYFHQLLFLKIPQDFSFKNKLVYKIKQLFLNFYKKNADIWITQSELVQKSLANKYFSGEYSHIKILPFYPPLDFTNNLLLREPNTFFYASNTAPHKNHKNLINAFCSAYDKEKKGKLIVTVPETSLDICKIINDKVVLGYPLINMGFIDRDKLINLYQSSEYLIFPSLAESFGLGLAEAIDGGCKIIASDLPYTYHVCEPSLTFNPNNQDSIESAIINAMNNELPNSLKCISNDINQLISLLTE